MTHEHITSAEVKAPAEIRTERLLLRRPVAADAASIFENYASDESIGRYPAWQIHRSPLDTEAFLKLAQVEWERWPAGPYLICYGADRTVIGSTGLVFDSPHCASMGYVLGRQWWGKGLGTEATVAMINLAAQLSVDPLVAYCHPENIASHRVLEKAGFHRDAVVSGFCVFPNMGVDDKQSVIRFACSPPMCGRNRFEKNSAS